MTSDASSSTTQAAADDGRRRLVPAPVARAVRRLSWKLVIGAFAILTVLIGLFTLHMVRADTERREAERWHIHTLEVLLVSEEFRIGIYEILRGERGYLLTDDETFLAPYHQGRANAERLLGRLRELTADNPDQTARVAEAGRRLATFVTLIDSTIETHRAGNREAALEVVRSGRGRQEFTRAQDAARAIEDEERRLLIGRRIALDRTAAQNEMLGYVSAGLIVLLLLISAVAAIIALKAQQRARAVTEELRRLATVDELTGLPNRRHFVGRLEEEMARAERNGSPLCLATLDIDHFKKINDSYGHPAGDAVLRALAPIIREKIRLDDSAARLGGEEFALLLPNTNAHQAHLVCDRLRAAIAGRLFEIPDGEPIRVTLSTGVALLHPEEDRSSLMRRSDDALYKAKAGGRNQVCLAV